MKKFMLVVLSVLLVFMFASTSFSADKTVPAVTKIDDKAVVATNVVVPVKAEVKAVPSTKATEVGTAVPVKEKAVVAVKTKKTEKAAKKVIVKPVDDKAKVVVPETKVAPAVIPAK